MTDTTAAPDAGKEALKKLKEARKERIARTTGRMKEQRQAVKAIKAQLTDSDLTVPEIAQATGMPASDVMWHVATMKKYGEVLEGDKAGDYYRYRLVESGQTEE